MLGYERTVAFFESQAVLEVDLGQAWSDGREFFSNNYDLVQTLQGVSRRGDSAGNDLAVSGIGGDPRWFLDYTWAVQGWDAGTTAAARNHSTLRVFGGLDSGTVCQTVIPYPGEGPVIRWSPDESQAISVYSGTVRLHSRFFACSVTTEGTNVPTLFDFGAYLRTV